MTWENHLNFKKYHLKPILAVDYGNKLTGLAQFCPGKDPFPLPYGHIAYKSDSQLSQDLQKVINEELIEVIVLGMPYRSDGSQSEQTKKVLQFKQILQVNFPHIIIEEQDEHLSSFEAKERMKNSPKYNFKVDPRQIDAVAACIILEDFLKAP